MSGSKPKILNVPTNIITGFLGVGKTSAIMGLLAHKPPGERWAVLVNEFGEIGVDGSIVAGRHGESERVFIKEVPGGCMCCTAGLPMQIALNTLLRESRPDRLLIEPTGLGHPVEVLGVLSGKFYREVLSIQKILTLVDARKLADERYTRHETFNQQIAIADVIIGNKTDLYAEGDRAALETYAKQRASSDMRVVFTEQGALDLELLEGATGATAREYHRHGHDDQPVPGLSDMPIPESGFVKARNQGEGFQSVGWRFTPYRVFDRNKLLAFLGGLHVERMKAVFITEEGVFSYNMTADALRELELDDCLESRIEIIATEIGADWEERLLGCIAA